MAASETTSAADPLETAVRKLEQGKRLTQKETAAVEHAGEVARLYLRAMPKRQFIERFDGSNKVYLDWEKKHGFPWNDKAGGVNVFAVVAWYRKVFIDGTESVSQELAQQRQRQEEAKTRKLELEAEKLERQAKIEEGNIIGREEALASLRTFVAALTEQILAVPDQVAPALPVDIVDQVTADLRRALERKLVAFSEQGARKIANQGATKD